MISPFKSAKVFAEAVDGKPSYSSRTAVQEKWESIIAEESISEQELVKNIIKMAKVTSGLGHHDEDGIEKEVENIKEEVEDTVEDTEMVEEEDTSQDDDGIEAAQMEI